MAEEWFAFFLRFLVLGSSSLHVNSLQGYVHAVIPPNYRFDLPLRSHGTVQNFRSVHTELWMARRKNFRPRPAPRERSLRNVSDQPGIQRGAQATKTDGEGYETGVTQKKNSGCFQIYRVYFISLNAGKFFGSWIQTIWRFRKWKKKKRNSLFCVHVLHKTWG